MDVSRAVGMVLLHEALCVMVDVGCEAWTGKHVTLQEAFVDLETGWQTVDGCACCCSTVSPMCVAQTGVSASSADAW